MIEIRPIQAQQELRAVEQLQRDVWGLADVEVVPDHLLLTAQKNGGLLLGAFDGPRLAGFVFGFLGRTAGGQLKHCSHMTGVHPDYQDQHLGYRLKLAQRERVLAQGIDLVTWTFDPLESRNAYLNFHKLGVTCRAYLRDVYGEMRDALNVGIPSDRFQVEWRLDSPRVQARLAGDAPSLSLSQLQERGAQVVASGSLPAAPGLPGDFGAEAGAPPLEAGSLLAPIPADFQALKAANLALARRWRLRTRAFFEAAFAAGYVATGLLRDQGQSWYLLEREEAAA